MNAYFRAKAIGDAADAHVTAYVNKYCGYNLWRIPPPEERKANERAMNRADVASRVLRQLRTRRPALP